MRNYIKNLFKREGKVFCISMQKVGTTSTGKFFRDFGFKWAGWPTSMKNEWSLSWYEGDYERIFTSPDFKSANAYEDSIFFAPGFYKILYHRFPKAKFILFVRDPDEWYRSMLRHSGGNVIGKSRIHCKIYRRELEYFNLLYSGKIDEKVENQIHSEKKMKIEGHAEHYKSIYRLHNIEVQDFFRRHAPKALHVGNLKDPDKWKKLGKFLGIKVQNNYESWVNVSKYRQTRKNHEQNIPPYGNPD